MKHTPKATHIHTVYNNFLAINGLHLD